jgi:quercetin dioxygenase-like cupin family protein
MNDLAEPLPSLCDRNLPHDARRELFGGKGSVRVWSLTPAPALPFTAVLACELEAGGSVGTHLQEQFPEIVIGISGTGSASVNGVAAALRAGSVVELARGHTLSIVNESSESPLRYLIIKAQGSGAAR